MMPSFTDFLDELRSFESGIKSSAIFTNGPTGTHPDGKPNDFRSTGTISGSAEATIIPILANNQNNPSDPLYTQSQQQAHALWDAWVSGPHTADTMRALQYHSMNSLGYVGYQFGEAVMQDLGYYTADSTPNTFDWQQSSFTGVDGFTSLASMETGIQEAAILRAFGLSLHYIEFYLAHPEQSGITPTYAATTINQYLGQTFTADNGVQVTITVTGVLAAAHLTGWNGVINLLVNHHANVDQNGTPSTQYMNDYGGYDASFFGSTASAQIAQLLSLYRTPINQQTHATANMTAAETLWNKDFNGDGQINGQPVGGGDQTFIGNSTNQTFAGTVGGIDTVDYSSATAGVTVDLGVTTAQTPGGTMGTDTLTSIENLIGSAFNDSLVGNSSVNTLTGGNGNDTLDGKGGADTMIGGIGDDTYIVDSSSDAVIEGVGAGTDIVNAGASYALSANVEKLLLTGTGDFQAIGNSMANILTGNSGSNLMDGGTGADFMYGGTGNDAYMIDSSFDQIFENTNEGSDEVYSSVSYALGANVEKLTLTGTGNTQGIGNSIANLIIGNDGNNLMDGGTGIDGLIGGKGDDSYMIDNSYDQIVENLNEGADIVYTSVDYALGANLENVYMQGTAGLAVYGNEVANLIIGNDGSNLLNGLGGIDGLIGGKGDDTYVIDSSFDQIVENLNEGTDTVYASVSYQLGANLETLFLSGAAVQGFGNAGVNTIVGTNGNNAINGLGGADVLTGNGGLDTFVFAAGQMNGDTIMDFVGNGAGAGDQLQFSGFGAGASLHQVSGLVWQIDYNGNTAHEQFTLANGAALHASDWTFV